MNPLTNATILLVDDNLDSCDLLRFRFEEAGASVVTAQTVNTALDAFRRCPAHAVIADIRIGTSDGYELLKSIRNTNAEYKGFTPVIAVTGFASPEDKDRAMAAGFSGYFAKPFNPVEVVDAVGQLLTHPRDLAA
jgi:two-component system, chemotaxis family, CheB/CheR fusion protein